MKFPHYFYGDIVALQHALVADGLKIDHLRLIVGTSMGGMQTWMWGETFPDFADGLMPIASQPVAVTGRNYMWRQMIVDAIRKDPDWNNGDYKEQPKGFLRILPLFTLMTGSATSLETMGETHEAGRKNLVAIVANGAKTFDANDYRYWFTAVDDYDPEPRLSAIKAQLLAVNFADDLLNPVELGVMERLTRKAANAGFIMIPAGPETAGHQSLTRAKLWAPYLKQLIDSLND